MTATLDTKIAELQHANAELSRRLDERTAERDEAQAEKDALAEVLEVINSSPGDLAPVFDAILEKAIRLCEAGFGILWRHEGDAFRAVADFGVPPAFGDYLAANTDRGGPGNQHVPAHAYVLDGADFVHVRDVAAEERGRPEHPLRQAAVQLGGVRSLLVVPLRKDDATLGLFAIYRQEVRPFTDKQIALLKNFAAQAVNAMDTARLISEAREALEQQTATAEVLQVINSSPGDLTPVFDAMLEKAHQLCGIAIGSLELYDGENFRAVAVRGLSDTFANLLRRGYAASENPATRPLIEGHRLAHIHDVAETDYSITRSSSELEDVHTFLCVPLRRGRTLIGMIASARREVRPFSDKEISLLENFAAQAVIAMENARLITETREALEQQTATAEVLAVINSSPGDLSPVFDAMLEKAMSLCGAMFGTLQTYDGHSWQSASARGVPEAFAEYRRQNPPPYGPGTISDQILKGEPLVHTIDLMSEELYKTGDPNRRAMVDLGGARTSLVVPLRKHSIVLGVLQIYRQHVEPFSDRQIALLQNFAAQAVIAMENARLITETREALDQQTATSEVLQVINSSPGDLAPVFDAMLEKAMRLCEADFGTLWTYDGERTHAAALRGVPPALADFLAVPRAPAMGGKLDRIIRGERLLHISDLADESDDSSRNPTRRAFVELGGARTMLWVALRKDDVLLGILSIYREEVRPFSDTQIALLENFAAQAVIAMENARLITETRDALERQTATAEILQVINSSPTDLQPVFKAIADSAARLCNALSSSVYRFDGELIHFLAHSSFSPDAIESTKRLFPAPPSRDNATARAVLECALVHIPDVREDPEYRNQEWASAIGLRSALSVPMLREGRPIGVITVNRAEAAPFPQAQISLLKTFADQAVIAIENTRLITETREALEQQTATAEVLRVINSSPGNLTPVFDAMLGKAMRLCNVAFGYFMSYDGEKFESLALQGVPQEFADFLQGAPLRPSGLTGLGRIAGGARLVHVPDLIADEAYERGDPVRVATVELGGARTWLGVPLLKDERLLGVLMVYRQEVHPFTEKQIALLQNFAAQAVIAMENARLITETREALEQQTATAEVLSVINSSPGDLVPVFDAMLTKAMELCGASFGVLRTYDGEVLDAVAVHGEPRIVERIRQLGPIRPATGSLFEPLIKGEKVSHIADLLGSDAYRADPSDWERIEAGGIRTWLAVALRKQEAFLGAIIVYRKEVRLFTDKQIALLQNFAAQAVIAMDNARLISETREALEQQTATAEVLQVINSSPGELAPVFDAILEKAMTLCGASFGELRTYNGERFLLAAAHGTPAPYVDYYRQNDTGRYGPGTGPARLLAGERVVHIPDLIDTEPYQRGDPDRRAIVDIAGARAYVLVPLLVDEIVRGFILVYREEARPFSENQIGVLQSFAAQAVIAMDNARLLNEIRQRQAELRVTFDNMGDGVAMFDADLHLAAWNLNFQQILGVPDAFLVERPTSAELIRYLAQHGEFGAVDVEAEVSRISDRMGEQWSSERTRPDGHVIEVRNNPVPGGGFVLIYSDITKRKRSEEEIRTARDTAEAALRDLQAAQANLIQAEKMASLGQLTAGIAHEIKNPLNFVNNFAGLSVELLDELKETAAPGIATLDAATRAEIDDTVEMLTGNLAKIAEHGKRADNIVKSMLEHSRGGSGERRSIDLNALVDDALNLAYHGARAQDQSFNIVMERDLAPDLPPIELAPQEITRVFLNLFGNGFYAAHKRSREAADGFRPTLKVMTRDLGEVIEIRVRDNGIGIPPEIRDKLFQPFFTTKPTGEGTGLGLSISYDIVTQQHGGTIAVESEPGGFTEFTVRLPRQ